MKSLCGGFDLGVGRCVRGRPDVACQVHVDVAVTSRAGFGLVSTGGRPLREVGTRPLGTGDVSLDVPGLLLHSDSDALARLAHHGLGFCACGLGEVIVGHRSHPIILTSCSRGISLIKICPTWMDKVTTYEVRRSGSCLGVYRSGWVWTRISVSRPSIRASS